MENEVEKKAGWKGLSFTQKIIYSVGFIVVMLFILGFIIRLYGNPNVSDNTLNNPMKEETFVVNGLFQRTICWQENKDILVNYELSSTSPIDIIFTPTQKDANDFNETSMHYPSCYIPDTLNNKGSCAIAGNGCLLLLNKKNNSATITLKYSAK